MTRMEALESYTINNAVARIGETKVLFEKVADYRN